MNKLMNATLATALFAGTMCVTAQAQTTFDRTTISKAAIQAELDDTYKQLRTISPSTPQQEILVKGARSAHDDSDAALRNGETLRAQELADAAADLLNALNPSRLRQPNVTSQATMADPVVGNAGDVRQVAREDIAKSELMINGMAPYSIAGGTAVEDLTALAKSSLADAKAELETDARRAYFDSRRARYTAHAAELIASASDKSLNPPPQMEDRADSSVQHAS